MKVLDHILNNDLKRLHEDVLAKERNLLAAKHSGYPLYVADVLGGKMYIDSLPSNQFLH